MSLALQSQLAVLPLPDDGEGDGLTVAQALTGANQIVGGTNGLAVDGDDDVTGLYPCLLCDRAGLDIAHIGAIPGLGGVDDGIGDAHAQGDPGRRSLCRRCLGEQGFDARPIETDHELVAYQNLGYAIVTRSP